MHKPNDTKRLNSNSGNAGQFKRSREQMIHVSAVAKMIPNPLGHGALPKMVPYTQRPGTTYNIGRNADKRALRVAGAA